MGTKNHAEAIAACEAVLREVRQDNTEHNILPRQVALIDQILDRTTELREAYAELHSKLAGHSHGLMSFFRALLTTADLWNPAQLVKAREDREALRRLNAKIAELAFKLAGSLEERDRLNNQSYFHTDTHFHIVDVIDEAASRNSSFETWVKKSLHALSSRFDLKYWPSLGAVIAAIGKNAYSAEVLPCHPPMAVGTDSSRPSKADFIKALLSNIDENIGQHPGYLPEEFNVTDNSLASLTNCILNLDQDDLIDGPYVKHVRQRQRACDQPSSVYPPRREKMGE